MESDATFEQTQKLTQLIKSGVRVSDADHENLLPIHNNGMKMSQLE